MTNATCLHSSFVIRISSFKRFVKVDPNLEMAESQSTPTGPLRCVIVTPEATVLDSAADFVALPLFDGEAGIAPGRAPLIGRLGYGELRVRRGGETQRFYVDGGFVQVAEDVVSVLTNRAVPANSLNAASAQQQLQAALSSRAAGPAAMAIRDRQISQARGQLRVAGRT
jgi:F-type H+-transporting ATPase subunit epsilon